MTSRLLPVQAEQAAEQPSDNLETGCPVELALNPKEPTFFRAPCYDFLIEVLKEVGSLGSR